jgi:hypothetical protein
MSEEKKLYRAGVNSVFAGAGDDVSTMPQALLGMAFLGDIGVALQKTVENLDKPGMEGSAAYLLPSFLLLAQVKNKPDDCAAVIDVAAQCLSPHVHGAVSSAMISARIAAEKESQDEVVTAIKSAGRRSGVDTLFRASFDDQGNQGAAFHGLQQQAGGHLTL